LGIQIRLSVAASTAFVMTDKTSGGKCILINGMINKIIDILKNKNATWFYVELPTIDKEALRKKIIAILKDKQGGIGKELDIPDDEIEALADVFLPGVIKFFSSDEWRAELEAWKKEQEEIKKEILKKEPQ